MIEKLSIVFISKIKSANRTTALAETTWLRTSNYTLFQSKNDLENFDESFNELSLDINDSGVSLNEFSM